MGPAFKYPHTAAITRNTAGEDGKSSFQSAGSTPAFLQPMDAEESAMVGLTFGKSSVCYIPVSSDVKIGDRLTISGITYGVNGMMVRDYGSRPHKRAALEQLS